MVQRIKFEGSDDTAATQAGLSNAALTSIFLGPPDTYAPPTMKCPKWARDYIQREYKACEVTFRALQQHRMLAPNPITGALSFCVDSFISAHACGGATQPVFKFFDGEGPAFCLVFAGLTSRVTHLIVPSRECVIHDVSIGRPDEIWAVFRAYLAARSVTDHAPQRRIGVVDMPTNLAHQAMNHLSGLQRLVDSKLTQFVDEIWVAGTEFYGRTEEIFPELVGKIRQVERGNMAQLLGAGGSNLFKIGSNMVTRSLRERIIGCADTAYLSRRRIRRAPVIAVTVRSQGRICVNLPDIVQQIVTTLLGQHPNLGIILDGWVFPETSVAAMSNVVTAVSGTYLQSMREEAALCREVAIRLPPGVLVDNMVGTSTLQSLNGLRDVDAYFAHVGTLQHKIAWFSNARGVLHGPSEELGRMECGPYSSEMGYSPLIMERGAVTDINIDTARGAGFFNYEIANVTSIIQSLSDILS